MTTSRLVDAPPSDASVIYETLAYLEAYDAVLDLDYAFVAYKETARDTGTWRVRIRSSQTAGAVFERGMIEGQARSMAAQGRSWFSWGYTREPSAGDPRTIQFRVHVQDGQPREIEMLAQLRRVNHSADEARSVRFAWPVG